MRAERRAGRSRRAFSTYGWAAVSFTLALTCMAAWALMLIR